MRLDARMLGQIQVRHDGERPKPLAEDRLRLRYDWVERSLRDRGRERVRIAKDRIDVLVLGYRPHVDRRCIRNGRLDAKLRDQRVGIP